MQEKISDDIINQIWLKEKNLIIYLIKKLVFIIYQYRNAMRIIEIFGLFKNLNLKKLKTNSGQTNIEK